MKRRRILDPADRQAVIHKLQQLLETQESVQFAILHGSFCNPSLPFGDIDIAVYLLPDPPDTLAATLDLKEYLEQGIGFKYEIDVQILNSASLGFKFHSSQGHVLLCRDEDRLDAFRQDTWVRYWDYEPLLRQSLKWILDRSPTDGQHP